MNGVECRASACRPQFGAYFAPGLKIRSHIHSITYILDESLFIEMASIEKYVFEKWNETVIKRVDIFINVKYAGRLGQ